MRIGINASNLVVAGATVDDYVAHAVAAEQDGFSSWWMAQLAAPDALTVLGAVGRGTSTIELGTAVVPTWFRHPLMLAAQALTTQEMAGGRLALGIGLAHKVPIEATLRIPFARPAAHMSDYLSVLLPALADRKVDFAGDIWSGVTEGLGGAPGVAAPPVLVAAMGPRMLELAGGRTDGGGAVAQRAAHHRRVPAPGPRRRSHRGGPGRAAHRRQRPVVRHRRGRPGAGPDRRPAGRLQRPALVPRRDGPRGRRRAGGRVDRGERGRGAGRGRALRRRRAPPTSCPSRWGPTPTRRPGPAPCSSISPRADDRAVSP